MGEEPAGNDNGLNDWGKPLTVTIPEPFADFARKMFQKHNKKITKMQEKLEKRQAKMAQKNRKAKKPSDAKVLADKLTVSVNKVNKDDLEVQAEIKELEKDETPDVKVMVLGDSEDENETPEKVDIETEKELKEKEMPMWVRRRIRAMRSKGDKLPAWLQEMLKKVDDGKEVEPKQTSFSDWISDWKEKKNEKRMKKMQKHLERHQKRVMPKWAKRWMRNNFQGIDLEKDFDFKFGAQNDDEKKE